MSNKTVFSLVIEATNAKVRKRRAPAAKAFVNKKRYTRKQKHAGRGFDGASPCLRCAA